MTHTFLSRAAAAVFFAIVPLQQIKADAQDERTAVSLTAVEKAYVLGQMRHFVESIQAIAAGLADNDHAAAAEAAAARGFKRNQNDPEFPASLGAKLPPEWKQIGQGMRKSFDTLAEIIAKDEDPRASLKQLSAVMTNCVACHASYRVIDATP